MSVKIKGDALGDIVPEIEEAIDKAFSVFITTTQGKLFKASPVETGRFASSWFIGKNKPSDEVRPENWGAKGRPKLVQPEFTAPITFGGNWYITNNLPYAYRVSTDPIWAKGGNPGANWYKNIVAQMPRSLQDEIKKTLGRL